MSVDVLRQVRLDDNQPDRIDESGVIALRARKWRWVKTWPGWEGWYALRFPESGQEPIMFYMTRQILRDARRAKWLEGVEFSSRSVQWPMEAGNDDDESPEYIRNPSAGYAVGTDDAEADEGSGTMITRLTCVLLGVVLGIFMTGLCYALLMFH